MSPGADDLTIAFVASPHPWVGRWSRHVHDHGPGTVADVIAEARMAFDKPWRVGLIAADHQLLTEAFVLQAHAERRGIVAVFDPSDPRAKQRALDADVDVLLEMDATPRELDRVLADVATRHPLRNPKSRRRPVAAPDLTPTGGQVIAVGGPPGSEAATVALTLATVMGRRNDTAALVEVDEVAPSVAQRTGLSALPNLASASAAVRAGGSVGDQFQRLANLDVVPGLADPGQWADVTPASVRATVAALAATHPRVVALVGPMLDPLGRTDRFGASRAVVADASAVVCVCGATPHGIAGLAHYVAGVRSLTAAPLWLVATGLGRMARHRRAEVSAALWRLAELDGVDASGVDVLVLGARAADRAGWDGGVLDRGPFAGAVRRLAREVYE